MHVSKVSIKNYRQIGAESLEVNLNSGLNVVIGENNIGKTTLVEAIALALSYGSIERGSVQLQRSDFHDEADPVEIDLEFAGLTDEQESAFIQALDISQNESVLRFQFRYTFTNNRLSTEVSCGQHASTARPSDLMVNMSCHYLRALRDVSQEFRPGFKNRIGRMLEKLFTQIGDIDKERFIKIFHDAENDAALFAPEALKEEVGINSDDNPKITDEPTNKDRFQGPIKALETRSNTLIRKLQFAEDDNAIGLGFHQRRKLADILHTVFPRSMLTELDLVYNGLGYNNLIYVAFLLTEIQELAGPQQFVLLIVEEPEAHLHPQLQRLLLEFLRTEYAGVQVVITSHSPNFVADSEINELVLLRRNEGRLLGVTLASLNLSTDTRTFLRKFLDITKSQLFFAKKIVFVEGYTEAILFRAFWDSCHADENNRFQKQSIEVVNIGNVAFKHYVELISKVFKSAGTKCVLLTDDDRGTGRDVPKENKIIPERPIDELLACWDRAEMAGRVTLLKNRIAELKREGCAVELFISKRTFEVDFGLTNYSNSIVKGKLIQPKEGELFTQIGQGTQELRQALELWQAVQDDKVGYALDILKSLSSADPPRPPNYFQDAFRFLGGTEIRGTTDPQAG